MSMGAGLCMPPMMFSTGMQHMHPPHFSPMGIGMGMGYGMGMGMEMNGGPHMFPFSTTTQGSRHPVPSPSVYGHPSQAMPMLLPQPAMPGIPIYHGARQVEVPDVGPSSKDPIHNRNFNAMTHTSSQVLYVCFDYDYLISDFCSHLTKCNFSHKSFNLFKNLSLLMY